ncbi:MAG: hypothetical protein Kow0077_22970 [Anaerolineae bacterium]
MSCDTKTNPQDCCNGVQALTPATVENRSGLSALIYRTGTHAQFKASMLAALSSGDLPELQALTTREDDDFSIALIDAWAAVLDVLTFYSERHINEHFLRTATERRSLKWLVELIGYRPRPGLAAETYLAFTVDDATEVTTVPAGTQVQSIPGPDELPVIFETLADQEVRARWNAMQPRRILTQTLDVDMPGALLEGNYSSLRPGSRMLIVASESARKLRTVARVTFDGQKNKTQVDFVPTGGSASASVSASASTTGQLSYESSPAITGIDQVFAGQQYTWGDSYAYFAYNFYYIPAVVSIFQSAIALQEQPADTEIAPGTGLFILQEKASLYGHNAPDYNMLPVPQGSSRTATYGATNWNNATIETLLDELQPGVAESDQVPYLYLDQTYDRILPDSWVVLQDAGGSTYVLRVNDVDEVTPGLFTLTSKVSRLKLYGMSVAVQNLKVKEVTAFCASTPVTLATLEDTSPVAGSEVLLADFYPELTPGQQVILSGEVPALGNLTVHERLDIREILTDDYRTRLIFSQALDNAYQRDTVTINANVLRATHGETQGKDLPLALGSGRADLTFQTLRVPHTPITHLADATAESGAISTLEVRVDGVRWKTVESFYGQDGDARVYITRQTDDGTTYVMFGDGQHGRRPSTGIENITATYRVGLGLAGNVKGGQLALLLKKPAGVRSVTNPLDAEGGADADSIDAIRQNATLGMHTLGRIVSLQDYADYARSYSGIGKAHAAWAWAGESQGIFITVGGQTEGQVSDETLANLAASIRRYGDPLVPLAVKSYTPALFRIAATVFHDPDYAPIPLEQALRDLLRSTYSYASRDFGQHVTINEVLALMQQVEGVVAVDLDVLDLVNGSNALQTRLVSHLPRRGAQLATLTPATLLLLSPEPVTLNLVTVE